MRRRILLEGVEAVDRNAAAHHVEVARGVAQRGRAVGGVQDERRARGLQRQGPRLEARELEPALELSSYVSAVKPIATGESAGYGRRFVAEQPTHTATIPIGYGDGVRRALTNNADVLVRGARRPLVGTVSMDNVTALVDDGVTVGDEAVLIGEQDGERILAEELARRLGTINYEITCGISARVPREHVRT